MAIKFSYLIDAKVIRIPEEVKVKLDRAKPPGIELWKFTADIILIGLAGYEQLKKRKNLQGIADYQIGAELVSSMEELMAASKKK